MSASLIAPELVKGLQERAARAMPPLSVDDLDGWWLRRVDCGAWWAGTVLAHGDATSADLSRRIGFAEEFYTAHGAATRFQVTPGASPAELDAALAERGYRREYSISLQSAVTSSVVARTAGPVRGGLDERPTDAWFEAWHAVHGGDPGPEWDMLSRVELPSVYASVVDGNRVVAVGRAVVDSGWAGVFSMATLPEARGQGAAASVLAALAGWAGSQRAGQMYLQVVRDNAPALRLYERAGFTELCRYHYRTREHIS
ncbi:GNAT family N-acetyltransferase [Acrocarpospora macrocephala]|uniref:N-acetyltransferase GCN5 n=1 Tax=Acrocarpospora macrocephala TaxID=150177 RepID=A0A5M3WXZ7_9ACTN|nr:GNAT family N-acetyltransferase [Acrocarpospora macrocephala]GES13630.1 N-acetyltransferase GCN5 [Acrocarpospora macrocephala]